MSDYPPRSERVPQPSPIIAAATRRTDPPTHKPRRVHATPNESDTMPTTPSITDVLDHDQLVRATALNVARDVIKSGGSIFGGDKPADTFGTDDLVDLSEYIRIGSVMLRTRDDHGNTSAIVGIKPDREFAKDARAEDQGPVGPYPPFESGTAVFVDTSTDDETLKADIKNARRMLKDVLAERGIA